MSVTVDANVLLYASDESSPGHRACRDLLEFLAAGPSLVHLFWPVVMAYLWIATHPRIFERPLEPAVARANLDALVSRPHVRTPGEGGGFWRSYGEVVTGDAVRGDLVSDAHVAALMREHGVSTIWTSDRGFRRFPGITARDPLQPTP